jgi:hypothetical protein
MKRSAIAGMKPSHITSSRSIQKVPACQKDQHYSSRLAILNQIGN